MRLVSGLYHDHHPFDCLDIFDSCAVANVADDLKKGDSLIIHGGGDISPSFYGKGRSSRGGGSIIPVRRDRQEWALMNRAKELGIPILGICRGAQMLCALQGGYLIQHINGHGGTHTVKTYDDNEFTTNSIHHQQLVPQGNYQLVAWTETRSNEYWDVDAASDDVVLKANPLGVDPEFVYYPEIKGVAVQWHPEMMSEQAVANKYLLNFLKNHVY